MFIQPRSEEVFINAPYSFDEDGGNVSCLFEIPYDDENLGLGKKFFHKVVMTNWTWTDDGTYPV